MNITDNAVCFSLQVRSLGNSRKLSSDQFEVSADKTVAVLDIATPFSARSQQGADSLHELRQSARAALGGQGRR